MNRRDFTRGLGLGLAVAASGLVPQLRAEDAIFRKIVVLGEGGVGKSALTIAFITGAFLEDYDSTLADDYRKQIKVGDRLVVLNVWDTVGQESHDQSRRASYARANLFVLCFDLASRESFNHVESRWAAEIARHAPTVSFLIAGCKSDLRSQRKVTSDEATAVAQRLHARGYCECSAKTGTGVNEVFVAAARATLS